MVEKYNENMGKVKNLRERAKEVRRRRQEEKEEKKRAMEVILTPPPKPVVMVTPTIVPALKFQTQMVEEVVQPVSPSHPPMESAADLAAAAAMSGQIVDIESSAEEEFL